MKPKNSKPFKQIYINNNVFSLRIFILVKANKIEYISFNERIEWSNKKQLGNIDKINTKFRTYNHRYIWLGTNKITKIPSIKQIGTKSDWQHNWENKKLQIIYLNFTKNRSKSISRKDENFIGKSLIQICIKSYDRNYTKKM